MHNLKKILYTLMITIFMIFIYTNTSNATNVEITTETLYLREKPTTDSNIIALISIGDECKLIEDSNNDWFKVQYGEYAGYISKKYSKIDNDSKTDSSNSKTDNNSNVDNNLASNNNNQDKQPSDDTSEKNESKNNISDKIDSNSNNTVNEIITATIKKDTDVKIVPLVNSSVIDKVKSNANVTVISQTSRWAYIQTDKVSGWVNKVYLNIKTSDTKKDINSTKNDGNTDDSKNDKKEEGNSNNTSKFEEKTMYTNDSAVNIRKEASSDAEIIMVVELNTSLKVIGESGDWYQIKTSLGTAYVSKKLLSNSKTSITNRGNIDRTKNLKDETTNTASETKMSNSTVTKTSASINNTVNLNSTNNDSSSYNKGQEVIKCAKKFLGVPYVYGGASSSGFDCSGFTMYVYDYFGISMRHGAQAQSKLGKIVNVNKSSKSSIINNLKAGDLVFFLDYETMDEIGHCGIYIENGDFIHASSGSGYCVKIDSLLPGEYYNTRYCATRRIL